MVVILNATRPEGEETKSLILGKRQNKLLLFVGDMIFYLVNYRELVKDLLKPMKESSTIICRNQ